MLRRRDRKTNLSVPDSLRDRILHVGSQFDINKGGHYDASGGMVVNVWCAPDDKPACWDAPIDCGALDHAREFVGTIRFEELTDGTYRLELEASPYELYHFRKRDKKPTDAELEVCLDWLEVKAQELVRLADLHPDVVGLRCPLCEFILPPGQLLNDMIGHVQTEHKVVVLGLTLSNPPYLTLDGGKRHHLHPAEQFV